MTCDRERNPKILQEFGRNRGKVFALVVGLLLLAAMPMPAQAPGLVGMYALIRAEETDQFEDYVDYS